MVHGRGKDSRRSSISRFTVTVRFKNTFRAITLLSVELQGSRSVQILQRDEIYPHARRELYTDKNTFRAITLLSVKLQSSRSVQINQRYEIYPARSTRAPYA